jgi:hypothetical protein
MDDADIGPTNLLSNKSRQTGHFIATGEDVASIDAAAERIGAIHIDQILHKGTEHAQIMSDFGTLTGAGFKQEPAARHPALLGSIQNSAEEPTHAAQPL